MKTSTADTINRRTIEIVTVGTIVNLNINNTLTTTRTRGTDLTIHTDMIITGVMITIIEAIIGTMIGRTLRIATIDIAIIRAVEMITMSITITTEITRITNSNKCENSNRIHTGHKITNNKNTPI